jgi:hypothetical protein
LIKHAPRLGTEVRQVGVGAVPASSARARIAGEWWIHPIVRMVLAVLASWVLAFAEDRHVAFENDWIANFEMDAGMWLAWLGPTVAAGFLLGLATWLPFAKVRYLWSRLLLAVLALVPIAQFWLLFGYQVRGPAERWLFRVDWFFGWPSQTALAVLVGVAIASGFRAAGSAAHGK